ncbi:MAG: hypothetical protein NC133_00830 [Prevotella sp.]|nr:hypothetical protein [Prevotella sp.]
MQSFTTQSHQRNYQGNVVVENSNSAVADEHRQRQRHKILTGITMSVMALAVAVTSSLLGATALHNRQLKSQIHQLERQNTPVVAHVANYQPVDDQPRTLEIYPDQTAEPNPNDDQERPRFHAEEPIPALYDGAPRNHDRKPGNHRAPISEKRHDTQPMPRVSPRHNPNERN